MVNRSVEGVLPTNFPSTVMSAPSGVDLIKMVEDSAAAVGAVAADAAVAAPGVGSADAAFGRTSQDGEARLH